MIVFNVFLPLFKGNPEIKVKIFSPNGTDEAGSYCNLNCLEMAKKKMINTNMEAATFFDISAVRKAKHLKKNNLYQVNKYQ